MTTKDIKARLMDYIANAEAKKLRALYTLLIEDEDKKPFTFSDEQMEMLEKRRSNYLSGKTKARPWKEVHDKIRSKRKNGSSSIPDEEWAKIDEDRAKYLRGEGKSYTWEEVKKTIRSKAKAE